jgi:LPS export ABC transporter protein LptC
MEPSLQKKGTALALKLRPFFLVSIAVLIIMQIVALLPSSLEQPPSNRAVDPKVLVRNEETTLATGIPKGKIPEYSVDQFDYVATQSGQKQWKLLAEKAFLYNSEKLVHARTVMAFLFDPEGNATLVTGKEAKYYKDKRDLEVFGSVTTRFPDGFILYSDYLRYLPNTRKIIIPSNYRVKGADQPSEPLPAIMASYLVSASPSPMVEASGGENQIAFESNGLDFAMGDAKIILPRNVHFMMFKKNAAASPVPVSTASAMPSASPASSTPGVPDMTTIESDHCVIFRTKQIAHFTMNPGRPLNTRFVRITQPTLWTRARRAELNYGDFTNVLQYLVAYDDVLIKEKGKASSLRYGTGGRADFDSRRNVIVLREFPQVYQDNDTVTGDVIIVHRDTDVVEVEHSNAFSEGEPQGMIGVNANESSKSSAGRPAPTSTPIPGPDL